MLKPWRVSFSVLGHWPGLGWAAYGNRKGRPRSLGASLGILNFIQVQNEAHFNNSAMQKEAFYEQLDAD